MELSTEDKQRIYKEVNRIFNESESVDLVHTLMFKSAEYATIYEREQQANGLKSIENPDHHIKVLKEQIQRMEKEYKQLEAERSELIQLIGDFWESYRQFNAIPDELENRILNSLKK